MTSRMDFNRMTPPVDFNLKFELVARTYPNGRLHDEVRDVGEGAPGHAGHGVVTLLLHSQDHMIDLLEKTMKMS